MPLVFVYTNVARANIPSSFLTDVTNGAAEIIGVDPKGIQVIVNPDCLMSFGGSTDPTAAALVMSTTGVLRPETNDGFAARFTELIPSQLGVPKERFYMTLTDVPTHEACYMGTTAASKQKT